MSKCASSSGIEVSVKDVRLSIYLKYSLGRANGTIRKSNERLTDLKVIILRDTQMVDEACLISK